MNKHNAETANLDNAAWRKSTRSGDSGNCVEVASLPGRVAIRDSKRPEQGAFVVPGNRWSEFSRAVKNGLAEI